MTLRPTPVPSGSPADETSARRGGPAAPLAVIDGLDVDGLDVSDDDLATILSVDTAGWQAAIPQIRAHYDQFGDKLPAQLQVAVDTLEARLG